MSEDYTYPTTPTLADLRTRVAELERENAELRERQSAQFERSTARLVDVALDAERQAQRVAELERQLAQDDSNMVALAARNAELAAQLDAVQTFATERRYPESAERRPMRVHPAVIAELHRWLMAQAPSGEGYSEFIAKALAWRKYMQGEVQP